MLVSAQRRQSCLNHCVRTRHCRRHTPRGERRRIQLMVRAQDQRHADQLRGVRRHWREVTGQCRRDVDIWRSTGDGHHERRQDPPPRRCHRFRPQVDRRPVTHGGQRQHDLHQLIWGYMRKLGPYRPEFVGERDPATQRFPPVEAACPDQRGDFFDGSARRQFDNVVAAIIAVPVGDSRDGRVDNRHAPVERLRRRRRWGSTLFQSTPQSVHVLAMISTRALAVVGFLRSDESAAHIRVESRPADSERGSDFVGGKECLRPLISTEWGGVRFVHGLID